MIIYILYNHWLRSCDIVHHLRFATCSVLSFCILLDPFIRLWAKDVKLFLFNAVLPWNMASMSETIRIEKMNRKNYHSWKYNIKLVLM